MKGRLQTLLPHRGCERHGILERELTWESDGPGFNLDSLTYCLYNLEQAVTSQSLSPCLLKGDKNVYVTWLW